MSSVVLTCGPSAVITRNLVSGSLSPTWIAIVNSPYMSGMCLDRGGGRYNIRTVKNGNRVSPFCHPWANPSAGKSAALQKGLLLRRHGAAEHTVTVREAAKAADDLGMLLGISAIVRIGCAAKQLHATKLVGEMLRMHEGHVEKFDQLRINPRIRAARNRTGCDVARHSVAGKRPRLAAKHVAGKLVEHDGQRQ